MIHDQFISFEGPEGAGKTTQIALLSRFLEGLGKSVLVTRQPGGDPVGVELRRILLDIGRAAVSPRAELLMMMADRCQSVDRVILPHLNSGGVVICDRYTDSSSAYQGGGRGIDLTWIDTLNTFATGGLVPAITILLDIDPLAGLSRQTDRNRMELEVTDFHIRVRQAYLDLAQKHSARIKVIDGSKTVESVHEEIKNILTLEGILC